MNATDNGVLDDLAKQMGSLIETERKRLKMTQEEMAERLGVSQNAITGWERAVSYGALHLQVMLRLERILRLPRGAIFQRLGLVSDYPDIEAVIRANMKMSPAQKDALVGLYRVLTGED